MSLIDGEQRQQATDPAASFIVQAPAGSGKTEILTQRFLRLLGSVSEPEQIVALTFTRKAASEMRERIIIALQQAQNKTEANSAHQRMTLAFAQQALMRSEQRGWNILEQANRLKISTIDALCQSISQSIPLLEKHLSYSQISDKPGSHYIQAARQCIQFALQTPEYQPAIKTLLLHVDNKQKRLIELFRSMLAQRDQWLFSLFQASAQDKSVFEQALYTIEQHELSRLKQGLPADLAATLVRLVRELACIENNPDKPRYILKTFDDFQTINQAIAKALTFALLGSDMTIRKSFDHHVGLTKDRCDAQEFQQLKAASADLLAELKHYPDFLHSLIQVSQLPEPQYEVEQWEVLQALFLLLPMLVSHLHLIFSEHNEVDFTAISQQALQALGSEDNPSDLTLYLDNTIHHILVDEFQDTSITQYELITRLVQGWQNGDGRTLFIVGDPMQSIYRFRQAEVGLFYRAQTFGIGSVTLSPLQLRCNFRSSETIVAWVNQHFAKIFPQQIDIESGAVSFHASVNVIKDMADSKVQALHCASKEQEAETLIRLIKEELGNNSEQTLAVLVRSRTHLKELVRLLRQHRITYQGTDIDLLANLPHLRDVWSLTQALLYPGNRLAWMEVLHSPLVGLSLTAIHRIARQDKNKSVYSALSRQETLLCLDEDARIRAEYFIRVMHRALASRCQSRLSDWVAATLQALHGDVLFTQSERNDLEQFWQLLDRYDELGRLSDTTAFINELNSLYSQQVTPSRLQIMTIHKSKGLEFDTVFLPGLGTQPNRGDAPMLRWLKLPDKNRQTLFLVSPMKAVYQDECPLYEYLEQIDNEKNTYEAQRLLYVAATRAKSRLYLLDNSARSVKSSFRALLKEQVFTKEEHVAQEQSSENTLPVLTRLPLDYYRQNDAFAAQKLNAPFTGFASGIPRLTGIIEHQLLQWICDKHPENAEQIPWHLAADALKQLGFDETLQHSALTAMKNQINRMLQDKTGAWILAKHCNEHNEYALLIQQDQQTVTRIIDRVFEEESVFWIIDFKTGKEEIDALTRHQQQLNEYGYCMSSRTTLPIQCGLYYLATNHWVHWQYSKSALHSRQ